MEYPGNIIFQKERNKFVSLRAKLNSSTMAIPLHRLQLSQLSVTFLVIRNVTYSYLITRMTVSTCCPNKDGKFLKFPGTKVNGIINPEGIAIDKRGNIMLCSQRNLIYIENY
jgi:hypothetical protein